MFEYRSKKQIREYYERELIKRKIMVELWEGVKRVYKKDGNPFAVLSKNYVGGKIRKDRFGIWLLEVGCYSEELRESVWDEILYVDDKSLEQIDEAIKKRLQRQKDNVAHLEETLQSLDEVIAKCDIYIKEGEALMDSMGINPYLRDLIRGYVKKNNKL